MLFLAFDIVCNKIYGPSKMTGSYVQTLRIRKMPGACRPSFLASKQPILWGFYGISSYFAQQNPQNHGISMGFLWDFYGFCTTKPTQKKRSARNDADLRLHPPAADPFWRARLQNLRKIGVSRSEWDHYFMMIHTYIISL